MIYKLEEGQMNRIWLEEGKKKQNWILRQTSAETWNLCNSMKTAPNLDILDSKLHEILWSTTLMKNIRSESDRKRLDIAKRRQNPNIKYKPAQTYWN